MSYGYYNWYPGYFIPWFSYYWTSNKDSVARRILEDIIEEYKQESSYIPLLQTGLTCVYNNTYIKEYTEGMISKFIIKDTLPDHNNIFLKYRNIDGEGYILKYFNPSTKAYDNITKDNFSSNHIVMCVLIKDPNNMNYFWNVITPIILPDTESEHISLSSGPGILIETLSDLLYRISLDEETTNKVESINQVNGNPLFKSGQGLDVQDEVIDNKRNITYSIKQDTWDKINQSPSIPPTGDYVPLSRKLTTGRGLIRDDGGSDLSTDVVIKLDDTTEEMIQTIPNKANKNELGKLAYEDPIIGSIMLIADDRVSGGRWLKCDGSQYSRTNYKDLYNAIGTKYGTGDGSTTFNIPSIDPLVNTNYYIRYQ